MIYRYLLSFLLGSLMASLALGQTGGNILNINDVSAHFNATGLIGMNGLAPGYFVPKVPGNTGPSPLFAANLWIGGVGLDDSLYVAASRFQQMPHDFLPGPMGTVAPSMAQYDRVWKVQRSDAAMQQTYFQCLEDPACDAQAEFPGYAVPGYFFDWPAHGDTTLGQAYQLADFYDHDQDGHYDPLAGDFPCFPGDQALLALYNDAFSQHMETKGPPIGVEVQLTPFAYTSDDPALNTTVFLRYRIHNRGPLVLHGTYIGFWTDFDLGNPFDDYVQCDVGRSLSFVYNGDDHDEDFQGVVGYGAQPPAFGAAILKGPLMDPDGLDNNDMGSLPGYNGTGFDDGIVDNERIGMSHFLYHGNASGITGDPENAKGYYNYMRGLWLDDRPVTYGGSGYSLDPDAVEAYFMFPGDSDTLGVGTGGQVMPPWDEVTAGMAPSDRRAMASMGPFTFHPGDMQEVLLAFVYARAESGGPLASVEALKQRTDSIRAFAETVPGLLAPGSPCEDLAAVGIDKLQDEEPAVHLYPNPASDQLTLGLSTHRALVELRIMDVTGQIVIERRVRGTTTTLDVSALAPGLYLAQLRDGRGSRSVRFIKE